MPAYLVIKAKVTDPARFAPYAAQAAALLERFGGQYLVRGGSQQRLEGEDDGMRVVVSRFPDRAAALAFWRRPSRGSSEDRAAIRRRSPSSRASRSRVARDESSAPRSWRPMYRRWEPGS